MRFGWSQNVLRHQILNRTHLRGFCDDRHGAEEVVGGFQGLPAVDPDQLCSDIDAVIDQRVPGVGDAR